MENKIPTSESLAAIIVANRSLGLFANEARDSMIELMKRKNNGDIFDYEQYISDKISNIPKSELNSNPIKLLTMLSKFGNIK